MPCVYYNDNSCNFSKYHKTKGVFYRHICSSCFARDGISRYKALAKKRIDPTLINQATNCDDHIACKTEMG